MPARPSVLLMIADDWSPLAGCYGNAVIQMPRVDAFAATGTLFEHGYCTSPSCAVSRASILTGQYSHRHGMYGHCHGIHGFRTHLETPSIPGMVRQHGGVSGCIGKKHVAPDSVYPFAVDQPIDTRNGNAVRDTVRAFLSDVRDQQFYLHVGFADPHRHGPGFGNEHASNFPQTRYSPAEVKVPEFLPDVPAVRAELAAYYEALSRLDAGFGLVLDELEASGRAGDTLVIITSDHGMPFPGAKASSFDTGHHCPLLLRAPGQRAGVRSQALVNWCSFMPTILEWMGIDAPPELPERSLLPILEAAAPQGWDQTWFSHCFHEVTNYFPYRVLRERRFKFVRNLAHQLPMPLPSDLFRSATWTAVCHDDLPMMGQRPVQRVLHHDREALFDLRSDPYETHNLIDDPTMQTTAERMRRELIDFRCRTGDPWLEQSFQEGEIGPGRWPM